MDIKVFAKFLKTQLYFTRNNLFTSFLSKKKKLFLRYLPNITSSLLTFKSIIKVKYTSRDNFQRAIIFRKSSIINVSMINLSCNSYF